MKCILVLVFIFSTQYLTSQIELLNDEFDDAAFMANWKNINVEEGWNITQLEWASINDSTTGHFQIAPYTSAWFQEWK